MHTVILRSFKMNIDTFISSKYKDKVLCFLTFNIANKKDQSITRIACHELTDNGTLSEFVYFSANEAHQDNHRYCELVMRNVEDPSGTWDVSQMNTKSKKMQQCVMEGTAEINCEGCDVRFFHNTIDSDQIFTPMGYEHQQVAVAIVGNIINYIYLI